MTSYLFLIISYSKSSFCLFILRFNWCTSCSSFGTYKSFLTKLWGSWSKTGTLSNGVRLIEDLSLYRLLERTTFSHLRTLSKSCSSLILPVKCTDSSVLLFLIPLVHRQLSVSSESPIPLILRWSRLLLYLTNLVIASSKSCCSN
jgi:hypothetical protein